jgi:phosphate acetyltransferase
VTRTLLLAPTGHGVGLTSVCLGLVHGLQQRGVKVGFLKPLAQPREHGAQQDRSTALMRLTSTLNPPDPIPAGRVEQALSRNEVDTLMEEVVAAAEPVLAEHDVVVIEGLVPGSGLVYSGRANVALAKALDADVLLVGAPWEPDDLEHLAETMGITARTFRSGERNRVVGAVVNRVTDAGPETVQRLAGALAGHGLALVGAVPERAELSWPRVSDAVAALDVEVLHEGESRRRVKEVLVAAQSVPGMVPLLREGLLLVVPGDRSDVLLAVCLAAMNGTEFAGLLLTVGARPDPQVWKLCRPALSTGLPVLLTQRNSYETATTVHDLDPEIPVDDAERAHLVMTTVAEALEPSWLATLPHAPAPGRLSPPAFRRQLVLRAREAGARIVLPEATEPRTIRAAVTCQEQGIARCVLLGDPEAVATRAAGLGLSLPEGLEVLGPTALAQRYVEVLVEARRHRGMTIDAARDQLADPIVLATTMLHAGDVDGMVAGAEHTTAATIRPALQVIGTAPGASLVSSVFFMCLPDEVVLYGDCAINRDPDAQQLADIALQSAASARAFGLEPRVAMISFSTGSSGAGDEVEKVTEATRLVREREPDLLVDGPLQYDAAMTGSVARSKAPDSAVAGRANVFVFPDLNTGNTTYKAVQRSAEVISIGPMLQGLARPVNDLSRGASVEDIVYTIAITAIQASSGRSE